MASTDGEENRIEIQVSIIEYRSVLPDFLDTEREIPGYCVGQIVSITLL